MVFTLLRVPAEEGGGKKANSRIIPIRIRKAFIRCVAFSALFRLHVSHLGITSEVSVKIKIHTSLESELSIMQNI